MDSGFSQLARMLLLAGGILIIFGLVFLVAAKLPQLRLGRLPGDLTFGQGNLRVYLPIATSILLSLLLTLILNLFMRR